MMPRTPLPNRRRQLSFEICHAGQNYTASAGFYADSRLGEIFVTARKPGSAVEAVARDCAIIASLALQHGVELGILRHSVTRDHDGGAATLIGAVLDAIAGGAT